jgi:ASC-1-like (ASCH) protein
MKKFKKYEIELPDDHFNNIAALLQTVYGTLNIEKFKKIKKGDKLVINGIYETPILGTKNYKTFRELLEKETLKKCLPGVDTIDNGIALYRKFYSVEKEKEKEKEKESGVLAIYLAPGNFKKLSNKYPNLVTNIKPLSKSHSKSKSKSHSKSKSKSHSKSKSKSHSKSKT